MSWASAGRWVADLGALNSLRYKIWIKDDPNHGASGEDKINTGIFKIIIIYQICNTCTEGGSNFENALNNVFDF